MDQTPALVLVDVPEETAELAVTALREAGAAAKMQQRSGVFPRPCLLTARRRRQQSNRPPTDGVAPVQDLALRRTTI
ncbi:hypothetical protein [Streptomyces sp. 142MFCol3.1]|uniref:hypothetical protein n=1 Tax=Streptomyces sp. 142MFCol3.1 TaxID=1172179 RepID=UPI002D219859|nr:hypothetical protein [Streptomyces sp. 142MFCol3.1]